MSSAPASPVPATEQSILVHPSAPALQRQELHELEPVSLPDQPCATVPPPVRVQDSPSAASGVGAPALTQPISVQRSEPALHRQELQKLSPVSVPDQPSSTEPPPARVQDCAPGAEVAGGRTQPILVHPSAPALHRQELQKFAPVSLPDQPSSTVPPPVRVHEVAPGAVVVSDPTQAIMVQEKAPALQRQELHELEPVSLPDQPCATVPPPVRVHEVSSGSTIITGGAVGSAVHAARLDHDPRQVLISASLVRSQPAASTEDPMAERQSAEQDDALAPQLLTSKSTWRDTGESSGQAASKLAHSVCLLHTNGFMQLSPVQLYPFAGPLPSQGICPAVGQRVEVASTTLAASTHEAHKTRMILTNRTQSPSTLNSR
jgi:hypothetical protein